MTDSTTPNTLPSPESSLAACSDPSGSHSPPSTGRVAPSRKSSPSLSRPRNRKSSPSLSRGGGPFATGEGWRGPAVTRNNRGTNLSPARHHNRQCQTYRPGTSQ